MTKGRVHEDPSNHRMEDEATRDSVNDDMVQAADGLINEINNEQELRTVIRDEGKELKKIFDQILQGLENGTILEMNQRENLPKVKLTSDTEESTNRILNEMRIWYFIEMKISLKLQTRSMQWERQLE